MIHDRDRSAAEREPAARARLPAGRDRIMIDLSHYLRKLDRPLVTRATIAPAPEPDRRSPKDRWPCLAGQQDQGADAGLVRARLGSYQRALTSARKVLQRSNPAPGIRPAGASLFISSNSDGGADSGSSAEHGGDL